MASHPAVGGPEAIAGLTATDLDGVLADLEARVPRHPAFVDLSGTHAEEAMVFGDSHGDWRCTSELGEALRNGPPGHVLIGLGDYIDRAPEDCPAGSVANALYLLALAAEFPDRVYLIQGNHELARRLGVRPHTLPRELSERWGPDPARYDRIMSLLERGPLLLRTGSGAYLAHAGFPRPVRGPIRAELLDPPDEALLLNVTWAEADASRTRRGAVPAWTRRELDQFLEANRCSIFLRGHDPDLTGRPLYGDRCLTLHSCRLYERYFGAIALRLPLQRPVDSVRELSTWHLAAEGRRFRPDEPLHPPTPAPRDD